jgi:hypothetical protein
MLRNRKTQTGCVQGVALLIALLTSGAVVLRAGVIGNVPLGDMKAKAARVFAGLIVESTNTQPGSNWTIQVLKNYQGEGPATLVATADRTLTPAERDSLRGRRGIFMLDASGALLRRTGSLLITDLYVPVSADLSRVSDSDAAFCLDWMHGLLNPGALIFRDLAVAAEFCASAVNREKAIHSVLAGSSQDTDRLIDVLVELPQGNPSALNSLLDWLAKNRSSSSILLENIAFQLTSYRSPDIGGSQVLRLIAESGPDRNVRIAAARAITGIHSDETWSDLALLLNSTDSEIQGLAVSGLYQTTLSGSGNHPFEKPLVHMGQVVKRNARNRPPVPPAAVPQAIVAERSFAAQENDATSQLSFWRIYAQENQ